MEKKKAVEFNFGIFLIILIIILVIVFIIARKTGGNIINQIEDTLNVEKNEEEYIQKLYAKDVIIIDEGKLSSKWEVVDKQYGSILFYIQGPQKENDDGTFKDIRINIYLQKSEMTNEELKKQMLEKSIYSKIEYTKMQELNSIQWMEFEAENKGVKAKILTTMKDGYMYAAEISGEETLYNEYYNEAMKAVMTIQISERMSTDTASTIIYQYDNIANIKEGGTRYLLTSLNLQETMKKTEEHTNFSEENKEYVWTGIKYEDFANEMKKYMTEEVLKNKFSEFIEYKGCLYIKETTGEQTEYMIEEITPIVIKGNETTYEVIKTQMNIYETIKQKITVKLEDGKSVVSNIE